MPKLHQCSSLALALLLRTARIISPDLVPIKSQGTRSIRPDAVIATARVLEENNPAHRVHAVMSVTVRSTLQLQRGQCNNSLPGFYY